MYVISLLKTKLYQEYFSPSFDSSVAALTKEALLFVGYVRYARQDISKEKTTSGKVR